MTINFNFFAVKERPTFTAEDMDALDPAKRASFEAVIAAEHDRDSIADKLTTKQADTKTLAFVFDKARLHVLHVQPQNTALSEARRMALPAQERMRLSRLPVPPEITEAIEAAGIAETAFENGKKELRQLQADLVAAKAATSAVTMAFQKLFPAISPDQLRRDYINDSQRRHAAGIVAPPDERTILAPIDAHMAANRGPLGLSTSRYRQHPDGPGAGRTYPQSMFGQRVKVAPSAVKPWQTKKLGSMRS